jgi:hypothetical protein
MIVNLINLQNPKQKDKKIKSSKKILEVRKHQDRREGAFCLRAFFNQTKLKV